MEAPESIAQEIAKKLVEFMTQAGNYFCEKVELGADVEVAKHWIH